MAAFVCSFVCLLPSPPCLSAAWKNSAPTGKIFMKFGTWVFFDDLFRRLHYHLNTMTITGTLYEDRSTFMIISR
jgi:hypothetical protein